MTKLEEAKKLFDDAVAAHQKTISDIDPFKKACSKAYDLVEKTKERYFSLVVEENPSWELLLEETNCLITYKKLDKELEKFCLTNSSYNTSTMQRCVSVCLYKNKDDVTEKTLEGLKIILPFIKPYRNRNELDGWNSKLRTPVDFKNKDIRFFSISERTLSKHGIYNLLVDKDNNACVMKTTYGHEELISKWDTLENTLKLIQKKYYQTDWADRNKVSEDEDDD